MEGLKLLHLLCQKREPVYFQNNTKPLGIIHLQVASKTGSLSFMIEANQDAFEAHTKIPWEILESDPTLAELINHRLITVLSQDMIKNKAIPQEKATISQYSNDYTKKSNAEEGENEEENDDITPKPVLDMPDVIEKDGALHIGKIPTVRDEIKLIAVKPKSKSSRERLESLNPSLSLLEAEYLVSNISEEYKNTRVYKIASEKLGELKVFQPNKK